MLGYCSRPTLPGYCSRADPAGKLFQTNPARILFPADPAGKLFPTDTAGILFPADTAGILFPADTAGILFPADTVRTDTADVAFLADAEEVTVGVAELADAGMLFPADPAGILFPADPAGTVPLAAPDMTFPAIGLVTGTVACEVDVTHMTISDTITVVFLARNGQICGAAGRFHAGVLGLRCPMLDCSPAC